MFQNYLTVLLPNQHTSLKESSRRKVKKPCSFAEALADLDGFSVPRKKATSVKFYDQRKNCDSGLYEVKPRKVYARKKGKSGKTNQQPCKFEFILIHIIYRSLTHLLTYIL